MLSGLLITAAVLALGHGSIYNWQQEPYNNNDFNSRVMFTENADLECNDTRVPDGYTMKYWIRPDLEIMRSGDMEMFQTTRDGLAGWQVNGTTMHIINVQGNHFGFYYCVGDVSGTEMVIKKGLNYQGPYFGDLWPEHRMNVIVGCSAAGGLIVIILVIFLVDKFYFDPKKDRSGSGSLDLSSPGSSYESDGSVEMKKKVDISGIDNYGVDQDVEMDKIFQHQEVGLNQKF